MLALPVFAPRVLALCVLARPVLALSPSLGVVGAVAVVGETPASISKLIKHIVKSYVSRTWPSPLCIKIRFSY